MLWIDSLSLEMKVVGYLVVAATLVACQAGDGRLTDRSYKKLAPLDAQLGEPSPGDWLAAHEEKGQTFDEYIASDPVHVTDARRKIYIQPIGVFSPEEASMLETTRTYIALFYGLDVELRPSIDDHIVVPDSLRRGPGAGDEQLLTGAILSYLRKHLPADALVVQAITPKDLYPSDKYNFVFGQALLKHRVGVSSYYRYLDNYDSLSFVKCVERLVKTTSHEIGHQLSCEHCTRASCMMNGSNSVEESDKRPNRLCSECFRKLQWSTGFDPKTRQDGLVESFTLHNMERDLKLAKDDLNALAK